MKEQEQEQEQISLADVIIASLSVFHHKTDKKQHILVLKKIAEISGLPLDKVISLYEKIHGDIDNYKKGVYKSKDFIKILYKELFIDEDYIEEKLKAIEDAWNILIVVDENSVKNLQYLISLKKTIFLIADTNYLNIHKIISDLNTIRDKINLANSKNSQIPNLALPKEEDIIKNQVISLAENINLITSFQYGSFKQEGLLDQLANNIKSKDNEILIISNNKNDLTKLKALLPEKKIEAIYINEESPTTILLTEIISLNSSTDTTSQKKDTLPKKYKGFFEKEYNEIVTSEESSQRNLSEVKMRPGI